jgi:oligopeptide/dipeptide ABC transporter ATP-binding protein
MIFQEPMTSLNPVFTVENQIVETIRLHEKIGKREAFEKALDMLGLTRIPNPRGTLSRYPHELSGGMRQRVMIAIALCCNPALLIADEPTTALDVTTQAQILDLIMMLKETLKMAFILITHNLGLITETVEKVMVMYAGTVVEKASTNVLFSNPQHPYTQGLLRAVPRLGGKVRSGIVRLTEIPGTVPIVHESQAGCMFANRCRYAKDTCWVEKPPLIEIEDGHFSRCWQDA